MKKSVIAVLLAMLLVFSLSACGGSDDKTEHNSAGCFFDIFQRTSSPVNHFSLSDSQENTGDAICKHRI